MLARCSRFSSVSDAASSNQVTTPRRRDRSGPRSAICLRCERRDLFNLCGSVALWLCGKKKAPKAVPTENIFMFSAEAPPHDDCPLLGQFGLRPGYVCRL